MVKASRCVVVAPLLALFVSWVAPSARATELCTFYGFIWMTDSESWHDDDSWYDWYPEGGVMEARYRYESSAVDGFFTVDSGNLWVDGDFIDFDESAFPDAPRMRVEGGEVTQFNWRPVRDGGFTSVGLDSWNWDGLGGGNVRISAPLKRPVPEGGQSALMLGLAATLVIRVHRRR